MAGTTREGAPIRVASLCRARGVAPPLVRSGPRTAGNDFDVRYSYLCSRLLKTGGTSFQAANRAGETAGRGRQGHAATETPKAASWRERIPRIPRAPRAPLEVGAGLDRESWQEFGGAPLGDARPSARPVTCARRQGAGRSQALRGEAKACCRFIDKPDNEAVTVEDILQPHRHRTLQARGEDGAVRAGRQRAELREAGKRVTNQTGAGARGLHAAVNTEGLPLGVLRAVAPQPGAEKDKPREKNSRGEEVVPARVTAPRLLRRGVQVAGVPGS